MSDSLTRLNPRAVTIQVGIRQLYDVSIYPLSFGDEIELLDIFSKALTSFLSLPKEEQTDMALAQAVTDFIKTNIGQIINLVIDQETWIQESESKEFMKCLDNLQLLQIVQLIYDMNFGEEVQKKAKTMATSLVELMKTKMTIQPTPQPN